MSVILDILISIIFGGMLLLIVWAANDNAFENQQESHGTMLVQENMTGIIQQLEGEFRNAGSGMPGMNRAILRADTSSITFVADLDGNPSSLDTLSYELGTTAEMASSPNELDRPLYRRDNNGPRLLGGIVTVLRFKYFDVASNEIPCPVSADRLAEIHTVEVTAEVQNPYGVHMQSGEKIYPTSMWQQTRLASRNTKR